MGKKSSIQTKLTLVMIAVSLVGMAAVFILNYFVMRESILEELFEKEYNSVRAGGEKIDGWFEGHKTFVDAVADVMPAVKSREEGKDIFRMYADARSEYLTVYVGLADDSGIFSEGEPSETWKATQRSWYISAMEAGGKTVVSAPYLDVVTGGTVIAVTRKIDAFVGLEGAFAVDIDLSTVIGMVNELETRGGYAFLVDQNGDIVAHPDGQFSPQGETYIHMADVPAYTNLSSVQEDYTLITDYDGENRYVFASQIQSSGWTLYAAIPRSAVSKAINPDIVTVVVLVLFLISSALIVSVLIRKMVVQPLNAIVAAGKELTVGNLDIRLPSGSDDEMGQLTAQFGEIVANTRKQAEVLDCIARRDFSVSIAPRCPGDSMNIAIQRMVDTISGVLSEINGSAGQVSDAARQISDNAEVMAQGAVRQTDTVEKLSAHVETFAEKARLTAENALEAKQLSDSIKGKAEEGSDQMNRMMNAVNEINESSRSIGKVIKIIDDIAFQTNILALNAAVEAARAGQHGKGFAVVADEVRNLAAKSAEAAKNTNQLIENSIQKAEMGAAISKETSESLHQIVEGIIRNSELIAGITQTSEEQSGAVTLVSDSINEVSQVIRQNSATSQESAAASLEMSEQSALLQELISQFKIHEGGSLALPPRGH